MPAGVDDEEIVAWCSKIGAWLGVPVGIAVAVAESPHFSPHLRSWPERTVGDVLAWLIEWGLMLAGGVIAGVIAGLFFGWLIGLSWRLILAPVFLGVLALVVAIPIYLVIKAIELLRLVHF